MNNEPVAIVNTNCENNIQWYEDDPKKHNGYFLYTDTAKTLTDEEITEIYNQIISIERNSWHEFARAILRKAQKK